MTDPNPNAAQPENPEQPVPPVQPIPPVQPEHPVPPVQPIPPVQPEHPIPPVQQTPPVQPTPPYAGDPYASQAVGPKTNVLAIIALIGGFVIPLAGIIVGFIALNQIKTTGEGGRGLAIGGIIVGFVVGALTLLVIAFSFILPLVLFGSYDGYRY